MSNNDKNIDRISKILDSFMSPQDIFERYCKKEFWTATEFACLMAGILPDRYEEIMDETGPNDISMKEFSKVKEANIFQEMLLLDLKGRKFKDFHFTNDNKMLSLSWKYIQWIAANEIPMKKHFYSSLPLVLKSLYFEFHPMNNILRKSQPHKREYHEALFLTFAQELMEKKGRKMSPSEIYNHPSTKIVIANIRKLGGKYKKRTYLEGWLPKLVKNKKGRPKKLQKIQCQ